MRRIFLLALLTPLILLYIVTKTCKIPTIDGLLSLLGAIYGGIISLVGIAWQIEHSKKKEENDKKQGLQEYVKYICNYSGIPLGCHIFFIFPLFLFYIF